MNPYLALGGILAVLAAFVAGNVHGHSSEKKVWQLREETFRAEAEKTKSAALEKARAAETANAAAIAKLEATRHEADVKTADADARVRDALRRMRVAQAGACGNRVSATGSAAGSNDTPGNGIGGLAGDVDDAIARTARAANELAAYARVCHGWVVSLPR